MKAMAGTQNVLIIPEVIILQQITYNLAFQSKRVKQMKSFSSSAIISQAVTSSCTDYLFV